MQITTEWLLAVGFRPAGGSIWRVGTWPEALSLEFYDDTAEHGLVYRLPTDGCGFLPAKVLVKSQEDVRGLCKALGVPLPEGV